MGLPPPRLPGAAAHVPIQLLNSDSNDDMRDSILLRLIGIPDFHDRLNSDSTYLSQSRVKFKNKVQLNFKLEYKYISICSQNLTISFYLSYRLHVSS